MKTPSPRGWTIAAITGALAIGVPLALHVGHAHPWEALPGFYGWFGGVGCAAIVLVAKVLGKWFLQKPEDFYD